MEALVHETDSVTDGDPETEVDGVRVPEWEAVNEALVECVTLLAPRVMLSDAVFVTDNEGLIDSSPLPEAACDVLLTSVNFGVAEIVSVEHVDWDAVGSGERESVECWDVGFGDRDREGDVKAVDVGALIVKLSVTAGARA